MAHFFGAVQGKSGTESTRTSTAKLGQDVYVQGWEVGVKARAFVDTAGNDSIVIMVDGGGNGAHSYTRIATVTAVDGEIILDYSGNEGWSNRILFSNH